MGHTHLDLPEVLHPVSVAQALVRTPYSVLGRDDKVLYCVYLSTGAERITLGTFANARSIVAGIYELHCAKTCRISGNIATTARLSLPPQPQVSRGVLSGLRQFISSRLTRRNVSSEGVDESINNFADMPPAYLTTMLGFIDNIVPFIESSLNLIPVPSVPGGVAELYGQPYNNPLGDSLHSAYLYYGLVGVED